MRVPGKVASATVQPDENRKVGETWQTGTKTRKPSETEDEDKAAATVDGSEPEEGEDSAENDAPGTRTAPTARNTRGPTNPTRFPKARTRPPRCRMPAPARRG